MYSRNSRVWWLFFFTLLLFFHYSNCLVASLFKQIPVVTRIMVFIAGTLFLGVRFNYFNPYYLMNFWGETIKKVQLWRLGMFFIFFYFYFFLQKIERVL